ncbi:hypothetical protein CHY08_18265 [Rhizobium leguminosarum bv. viciae]|uniref:hypothetical protein n=1 Tax=Rhizobium leguminosarum TaxID=384 RepID=UPI000B8CAAB6|nr:hypothetical protein [Rhizobium leguminosarum]ASR08882.1 hypothetical protein CHY08_18265 [Rhizobium leguminosarum bv. viciae]
MPNAQGTVEGLLHNIDLDIQRLRAERDHVADELQRIDHEIQRAEEIKRSVKSYASGSGTIGAHVSLAKAPRVHPEKPTSRSSSGVSQRQQVIDLAIAILKDRDNKPIRREELWEEMQARGFQLRKSNPTHYIASKVIGAAKNIFGNQNGYFLLDYPRQSAN